MRLLRVENKNRSISPIFVKDCRSFLSRLQGLMFVRSLENSQGILLDEKQDSRVNTSIHMLFMNFDITAVWINSSFEVVDKKVAKKWALAYLPQKPARYILEISTARFNDFTIGDRVSFRNVE